MSVARAFKRVEYQAVIESLLVPFLQISGVIASIHILGLDMTAQGAAGLVVAASAAGAALAALGVWRLYPLRDRLAKPVFTTGTMLAFAWPLLLKALVNRAGSETELLVLGSMVSSAETAVYYVVLRTTPFLTLFLAGLSQISTPMMAELHGQHRDDKLASLLKTVTRWGLSLSLPIFLVMFILADEFMALFGPDFSTGATVLKILAVSQLINVAVGPVGWLLMVTGHTWFNFLNDLISVALSLVLSFLLIPHYGIVGAGLSNAASIGVVNIVRLVQVNAFLHMHPFSITSLKPLVAGLLSGVVVACLQVPLVALPLFVRLAASALALLVTYAAAIVTLGLDDDDRVVVRACRRRMGHLLQVLRQGVRLQ
jgi:O-antigen/teichoic acid export membrane protein